MRNHKTAYNSSGTRESAANTAQTLTAPAAGPGNRVHIDKASVFIKAAAAAADVDIYARVQCAEGSAYTYTDGTGVISAITFTKGVIQNIAVGDEVADDGAATTFFPVTAVDYSAGTFTTTASQSATLNGGAFKVYKVVQGLIGSGAARGEGIEFTVNLASCENGKAQLDIDAGGASVVTVGNMPYRVTGLA